MLQRPDSSIIRRMYRGFLNPRKKRPIVAQRSATPCRGTRLMMLNGDCGGG